MEEIKTYVLEEQAKGKGNYGIAASAVPYAPSLRSEMLSMIRCIRKERPIS